MPMLLAPSALDQRVPATGVFLRAVCGLQLAGKIFVTGAGVQHRAPLQEELYIVR